MCNLCRGMCNTNCQIGTHLKKEEILILFIFIQSDMGQVLEVWVCEAGL